MTPSATIFDIQRFSVHDGPVIRTTVFFKGCSLRCAWCQNPESQAPRSELMFFAARCIDCRACVAACPRDAISLERPQRITWSRCDPCGACATACVTACPSAALETVGRRYDVDEVVSACSRDLEFARATGGGVTLSGGEAVLQSAFLQALLPRLQARGLHTLLQTAGHYPWRLLEPLLGSLDELYFDWKAPASSYREHTGATPERVMDNLGRLVKLGFPLTLRMAVVPGVNSRPEQVQDISRSLLELGITELQLLRYNHLWEAKLPGLDTAQRPLDTSSDAVDQRAVAELFEAQGVHALCPSTSSPALSTTP